MLSKRKYWTKIEEQYLKDFYGILFAVEIAEDLKRTSKAIRKKARKLKLSSNLKYKPRIYKRGTIHSCEQKFFSRPNILNCYYAGFIAADGCIVDTARGQKTLQIILNKKDRIVLENLKKDIKYTGVITEFKKRNEVTLQIKSDSICDDLYKNFNITPRKSLTLNPPKGLSKKQELSFLVGLIDGDGSIHIITPKNPNHKPFLGFGLAGSKDIIKWASNIFHKELKVNKNTFRRQQKIYSYQSSHRQAKLILKPLSKIKVPKLDRKWEKIIKETI